MELLKEQNLEQERQNEHTDNGRKKLLHKSFLMLLLLGLIPLITPSCSCESSFQGFSFSTDLLKSLIGIVCGILLCIVLFHMAKYNRKYRIAGILKTVAVVCTAVVGAFIPAWMNTVLLPEISDVSNYDLLFDFTLQNPLLLTSIIAVALEMPSTVLTEIATFIECRVHAVVMTDFKGELSKKWHTQLILQIVLFAVSVLTVGAVFLLTATWEPSFKINLTTLSTPSLATVVVLILATATFGIVVNIRYFILLLRSFLAIRRKYCQRDSVNCDPNQTSRVQSRQKSAAPKTSLEAQQELAKMFKKE